MRTKALITALLFGTTIAGAASADPIVRDHRVPVVSFQARARFSRPRVQVRPMWMQYSNPYGAYGYQVDADGDDVVAYNQGQDPYVEGIARGEWMTLAGGVRLAYNQDSQTNIDLGGQPLRSIEIQATGGRNLIREVHVELNDGRELKLQTNRTIQVDSSPNLRLDLGASAQCGVRRIEVFGWSSGKGQFRILGA
jgi:hypothetical protein